MFVWPSGTSSKAIAAIKAPAPNPARMPITLVGTVIQQTANPARNSDDWAMSPNPSASSSIGASNDQSTAADADPEPLISTVTALRTGLLDASIPRTGDPIEPWRG